LREKKKKEERKEREKIKRNGDGNKRMLMGDNRRGERRGGDNGRMIS
jgi:hypothetical protein